MIGHTGNYKATVLALEFIDKCLKSVLKVAKRHNYKVLITADHGNSEEMLTANGEPQTAHSLNDVFCAVYNANVKLKESGGLKDIAPTFLDLMDLPANKAFKGESLISKWYWQIKVYLL